jgi:hypothetical protein
MNTDLTEERGAIIHRITLLHFKNDRIFFSFVVDPMKGAFCDCAHDVSPRDQGWKADTRSASAVTGRDAGPAPGRHLALAASRSEAIYIQNYRRHIGHRISIFVADIFDCDI